MFWYVVSAIVLTIGTLVAGAVLLPIAITRAINHPRNCNCNNCMQRRMRKWDRLNEQKRSAERRHMWMPDAIESRPETEMVSTNQLVDFDKVTGKDIAGWYVVNQVERRSYGCVVILSHVTTGKISWVVVRDERMDVPLWKRQKRNHRKGHVTGL